MTAGCTVTTSTPSGQSDSLGTWGAATASARPRRTDAPAARPKKRIAKRSGAVAEERIPYLDESGPRNMMRVA